MAGARAGSHGPGPRAPNGDLPPSLLVLIGSTWSAVASVIGALVVALATWLRSDWVFPSVFWALVSFALPALAAAAWRAFVSGQPSSTDPEAADRASAVGPQRLKIRIGPEEWSEEKLPCFSTLPRLQHPVIDADSLQPSLLREAVVRASVDLRPGVRSSVPIRTDTSRPPLVVLTPPRRAAVSATLRVREGPDGEPEVSELLLEALSPLSLFNIVPTLVNLHHVVENLRWALFLRRDGKAAGPWSAACGALVSLGKLLLMGAELIATVHLTRVVAKPRGRGRHLSLKFYGRVSMLGGLLRVPFWAVRLPDFLLPSPHGRLVKLLTKQPLASAVIRDHSAIPMSKLAGAVAELVAGFEVSAEVAVEVPEVEVEACLPDATVIRTTARLGSWAGALPTLRASGSATGRISRGSLQATVQSMTFGSASMSGSVQATDSTAEGGQGPPLLEALVEAFDPLRKSAGARSSSLSGSEALATVASEVRIQEGSVLPDVYLHMTVHHPLMKCGHKLWGAARGPTLGGALSVRGVELLRGGRCAGAEAPVGELRLACSQVEIPMAEPDSEPSTDSPQVACGTPRTPRVAYGMPASTFRTGSTVTALSLSGGRINCLLTANTGDKFTVHVDYGCSLTVDTEADIGYFPELGVQSSETLQGQANARLEGAILADLDVGKRSIELLPATCISLELSDTAVSLGDRALRIPDASTVALAVAAFSVGLRGLEGEPCLDIHWHCGGGKSPTLADVASDLPALELLGPGFRDGSLRLLVSSAGRVRIEDSPPRLLAHSPVAALVPAISVVRQHDRRHKGPGHVADWRSISAWLDPLSPEGGRRWAELLKSRELEEKVLLLCCIVAPELQPIAKRLFAQIHRLLDVLRQEGISGLRDIIPAPKLSSVLARMLSSDGEPSKELLEPLYEVVKGATEASGIDIPRMKELLISHIPLLEDYPFELDRALRIMHLTLAPTPPMPPIAGQYAYPVARRQQHQGLLRGLPSAAELYAAVDDAARPLQPKWAGALASVAPLLTYQQLEYVLSRRSDWPRESFARLTYVFELKKRVKQLSADWGGVMHFPQAQMIALFLGNVIHASLRWPERAIDSLPSEAQFLAHLSEASARGPAPEGEKPQSLMPKLAMQEAARTSRALSPERRRDQVVLGSLLGPEDVAALLRIALANIGQSYVVQENFRMLLELTLSQPPNFLRGVLYELSDNGSQRNLTQVLLRLLDVRQDAFQTRIDIAALFESQLGIAIPRRWDYVAGGRWCRQSYYQEMFHAAAMILEEAEPYLAVQSHVQVALPPEEMLNCPGAGLDKGLTPGVELPTKRAIAAIREADDRARAALAELNGAGGRGGGLRAGLASLGGWGQKSAAAATAEPGPCGLHPAVAAATSAYFAAFSACRTVLRQETSISLGREWFRTFWQRNHEALMLECLVRAVQQNVDSARDWLAVQPGVNEKALEHHQWGLGSWANEQWLIDCIIDITYFFQEDRERIRSDPLVRLLIANDPAERYDFTVISVMGVVTHGIKGLELEKIYHRYTERRGVVFVRADTGIAKSHEYNAAKVEEAVRKVRTKAWGMVGYSQGGANAFKAESKLCGGTPEQRALVGNLACRNFLFPAANGAVQATCGEWKVTRFIVECEKLMKHYQASVSSSLQEAFLDLLWTVLSSRGLVSFLGGFHSLSHQGVQTLWREAQHKDGVPTTNIRGVVEDHTLPESLELMAAWHSKQLESPLHDTQVALDEAVGHPVHVHNANSTMLDKCDLGGAVQRMSHWAPLDEATEFITTESDIRRRIYDIPKDRFIYPWIELNARFGFVPKVARDDPGPSAAGRERVPSFGSGQVAVAEAAAKECELGAAGRASGRRPGAEAISSAPSPTASSHLAGAGAGRRASAMPSAHGHSGGEVSSWNRSDSGNKLSSLVRRQRQRTHKQQRPLSRRASSPSLLAAPGQRPPLRAAQSAAMLAGTAPAALAAPTAAEDPLGQPLTREPEEEADGN